MAHLSSEDTRADRRKFEKAAAEALAGLAHVLMIDYLRGWNGATKENIRLAETALEKAYTIHRSVPLAHVAESKIREVQGDLEGSIHALDEALALDPKLSDAYAHKANAFILLGAAEKAPPLLMEAIKHRSDDSELGLFHWFMGRAYFNMNDRKNAIEWLEKSVKVRPTTWFTWAHLISAYVPDRLGDARTAVIEYRRIFGTNWSLDPNIREYYRQPKYRDRPHQLEVAVQRLFNGLEDARKNANFP